MPTVEHVPDDEAERIENVIRITREQMAKRYPPGTPALRGQHAKDHACVSATFKVLDDIPADARRGIFATPGREHKAWIRFSNASAFDGPDSTAATDKAPASHGSRGMALKILDVNGSRLMPGEGLVEQDFLMVNHPVFPFANVEDYEAVSKILAENNNDPTPFFGRMVRKPDQTPDLSDPMTARTVRTAGIVKRIQSLSKDATPPAFQTPPVCPIDNQYFAGSPFLFGDDKVMRVRMTPVSPAVGGTVDVTHRDYLRDAMAARLAGAGAVPVSFEFQIQIRPASDFVGAEIDTGIEDASRDWDDTRFPFTTVAVVTIPPQDPTPADRRTFCESLSFSPWHGIEAHRPLGGINRLRRAVYEASRSYRQHGATQSPG